MMRLQDMGAWEREYFHKNYYLHVLIKLNIWEVSPYFSLLPSFEYARR